VRRDPPQGVVGVRDDLIEQAVQVRAAKPIQPGAAVSALVNKAADPQLRQVLAGRGGCAAGRLGQRRHAQFAFPQGPQQSQPGRLRQHRQAADRGGNLVVGQELSGHTVSVASVRATELPGEVHEQHLPTCEDIAGKSDWHYILIFTNGKMRIYAGPVNTLPALLLAAVGVGLGHAVLPDHWLPLAVLSRTRRYRTARVLRFSLAAALAHVVVSVVLGGILIVIGLQFRAAVARHTDLVIGGILLATGAVYLTLELLGNGHGHHHHHDSLDHDGHAHRHTTTAVLERPEPAGDKRATRSVAGLLIPFGAAASPDLTILPVFLAASALGTTAALGSLAAFTVATASTIVGLTTATALGARLFTASWIDRRANLITALILIAMGSLVAARLS
jgi:nickel/cobalt transporter (NicO) family protein